jgi:hypothetical protein
MLANISTETTAQEAPLTRDDREALVEIVRAAHQAVREASRNALREAITAGLVLLHLKEMVKHGEWGHYLRQRCELSERTAQIYMRLAEHHDLIEADPQRAADLSLRGALKLIPGKRASNKGKSTKSSTVLSTLSWSNATADERRHFVDGIGLPSWLAAMPPAWRPELERRINGQRARMAGSNSDSDVDATISKALPLQLATEIATLAERGRHA